jgi:ornithine cyclodeaminase
VTTVLTDADVARHLTPADAVRWMGEAVDHHRGELVAPPRVHAELGDGRLVFTTGRLYGAWFGCRSYNTFPGGPGAQVVAVHDEAGGALRAAAVGSELGPRRAGAIGGVAADALARPDAATVAVIGSGVQAGMQVWGLSAVRRIRELRVHSRHLDRRDAFATRVAPLVAGVVVPVADARTALEGADIVVLATSSPVPVVEASWLSPGAYVTTVGPKQQGRAEFGLDLPAAADVVVADSLAQVAAYDPPNVLVGSPHLDRLVSLGAVRAGSVAAPAPASVRVFFSVGLAGTEAYLLDRLASSLRGS